jgi:hypothetical protein
VLAAPRGIGLAERVGYDVLGQRVDRRGNGVGGVGLIRPVSSTVLVRSRGRRMVGAKVCGREK